MKHSATDISLKYLGALSEAVRQKNASKYGKQKMGVTEDVEPDGMGADAELGDDDLSSLLESTSSAENQMGDDFTGEGSDVGNPEANAKEIDQATLGESPTMALFKKKTKPLTKG